MVSIVLLQSSAEVLQPGRTICDSAKLLLCETGEIYGGRRALIRLLKQELRRERRSPWLACGVCNLAGVAGVAQGCVWVGKVRVVRRAERTKAYKAVSQPDLARSTASEERSVIRLAKPGEPMSRNRRSLTIETAEEMKKY